MVGLMVVAVGSVCVVVIAEGAIAAGYDAFVKAECSLRTGNGDLAEIHLSLVMLRKFDVVGHGPPSNYPFRKVVAGISVCGWSSPSFRPRCRANHVVSISRWTSSLYTDRNIAVHTITKP